MGMVEWLELLKLVDLITDVRAFWSVATGCDYLLNLCFPAGFHCPRRVFGLFVVDHESF
jgi:hypothetical protein